MMLGISLFSAGSRIMSGLQKRKNRRNVFFEVCIYLEQMEGAYRKKPKDIPVSIRNRNAFSGWKNERSVTEGSEGV